MSLPLTDCSNFVAAHTSLGVVAMVFFGGALMNLGDGSFVYYFGTMAAISLVMFAAAFLVDRHIEPLRRAAVTPDA